MISEIKKQKEKKKEIDWTDDELKTNPKQVIHKIQLNEQNLPNWESKCEYIYIRTVFMTPLN